MERVGEEAAAEWVTVQEDRLEKEDNATDLYWNMYSLDGNRRLPNTLYDPDIEAYFSRLNLDPDDRTPSFQSFNNMSPPSPQIRDDDLMRMRFESSVRGQSGLYLDHQNIVQESFLDDFRLLNLYNDYLLDGGQNRISSRNGYPSRIMPHNRNQNSAQNLNSNFGRFGIGLGGVSSSYLGHSSSSPPLHIDRLLKFFTLEELRGYIYLLADDRDGSKLLWDKIKEGKPKDVEMIFVEVRDHVSELMVSRVGSDFIQKFFEVCDQRQITQMLLLVLGDENLMGLCCHLHGARAMQKLVTQITTKEQKCLVVSSLAPLAVNLMKNQYGCHVIQGCLQSFPSEDNRHIFHVVAENCVGIAMDKHGCRVLQKCLDYAQGEAKENLTAETAANALVLSESQYGNYVVQCILEMRIPHITATVLDRLVGSYVYLSMNKYGSNVVESCIKLAGEDQAAQIISEMITDPNFLGVLQDPFGNYVAQSALERAKGGLRHSMVNLIQMHSLHLQSHPYGKRVLAATKSRARSC